MRYVIQSMGLQRVVALATEQQQHWKAGISNFIHYYLNSFYLLYPVSTLLKNHLSDSCWTINGFISQPTNHYWPPLSTTHLWWIIRHWPFLLTFWMLAILLLLLSQFSCVQRCDPVDGRLPCQHICDTGLDIFHELIHSIFTTNAIINFILQTRKQSHRKLWSWGVNSGSWWWTGRPGVLRFMGLQRVGHDWATELNWLTLYSTNPKKKKQLN